MQQQHVEAEEEEAGEHDVPHPLVVLGREPPLRELGACEIRGRCRGDTGEV